MIDRICKIPNNNSFFLFGARGVGKTSLLRAVLPEKSTYWIDLLNDELVDRYSVHPKMLKQEVEGLQSQKPLDWIVIDEIQKVPKLLNGVHQLIESEKKYKFALTGSSARRLKQKGVNLLAGRAWVRQLHPFTALELGDRFDLSTALAWGTLPKVIELTSFEEKADFLRAYGLTYVKTEIQEEQWVKKIEPFRKFLPIAAQMNGKPLNYSSVARDVGVDTTTVQSYYEILEDTLLGFHLPAFHLSVRKQQRQAPKFYFFDTGVKRALAKQLNLQLVPQTYEYGFAFEHWLICEMFRLNDYFKKDFEFSYLLTKDHAEIDCIVRRPGKPLALVEIKSSEAVTERDVRHLERLSRDLPKSESYLLSLDQETKKFGSIWALPWDKGLKELFS